MFHQKHTLQCFIFYAIATRTDGDSPFLEELGKAKTPLLDLQNKRIQCLVILHAQRSMLKEVAVMQKTWAFEMLVPLKRLERYYSPGRKQRPPHRGCHNG